MKKLLTLITLFVSLFLVASCQMNETSKNKNNTNNDTTINNEINTDNKKENTEKEIFSRENQFIEIKNSYTYNENINILLKNVDLNKYNVKYLIKYLNKDNFEELANTSIVFNESYNHSIIKAQIYKDKDLLYTSDEVLLYHKQEPKEFKQLTETQRKLRNLTTRNIAKIIKGYSLLLAIGHNSPNFQSTIEFPFPTEEKLRQYEENKETIVFENNEIENFLSSIYQLTLSQIKLRTSSPQFPRIFQDTNLQGLDKLINITHLDLSNNTYFIQDLEEIFSVLTKIESLKLNSTKIKDFTSLAKFNIKELHMSRSDIDDTLLENIVKNFPNLEILNISSNPKITSLEPLKGLKNLKVLYMDNLNLDNLDSLNGLNSLEKLSIVKIQKANSETPETPSKLQNYDFLNSLTNLKYLDITSNNITTFEFLNHLTNLNELRMANTNISEKANLEFENIKKLVNLTKLVANQTNLNIIDLSYFQDLMHLTDLDLSNTLSIKKINFKKPNSSLRFVNLSYTKLDDLETKYSFKNIIELAVKSTPYEEKQGDQDYYNSDEVSYFDGLNYIIDHGDHYHLNTIEENDKFFYRTDIKNPNLLKNQVLIGFTKDGYFINSIVKKGKYGNNIYNIFYFEGLPVFSFNLPDYKDNKIKYASELLETILDRKVKLVKSFDLNNDQIKEIDNLLLTNHSIESKISELNKYYKK